MNNYAKSIDEQIKQAIQRGEFDDLPGKGQPLDLSENPYEDPGWRLAHRLLKENGYTLPWIDTRNRLEKDYQQAMQTLARNWQWRQNKLGHRGLVQAEKEWQLALEAFRNEVITLNKRIRDYNLEIPSNQFQRRQINAEQEILKITTDAD
jgi:DnaJ family protein C protein 28